MWQKNSWLTSYLDTVYIFICCYSLFYSYFSVHDFRIWVVFFFNRKHVSIFLLISDICDVFRITKHIRNDPEEFWWFWDPSQGRCFTQTQKLLQNTTRFSVIWCSVCLASFSDDCLLTCSGCRASSDVTTTSCNSQSRRRYRLPADRQTGSDVSVFRRQKTTQRRRTTAAAQCSRLPNSLNERRSEVTWFVDGHIGILGLVSLGQFHCT